MEAYSIAKVPWPEAVIHSISSYVCSSSIFNLSNPALAKIMQDPKTEKAVEQGMLDFVQVMQTRIKITSVLGQIVLYERVLEKP